MKLYRRLTFVALTFTMYGCLPSLPERPATAATPVFDPIVFFTGKTQGEGTLLRRFGDDKKLTVASIGVVDSNGVLTLHQTITFATGDVELRKWIVRRVDATRYHAVLSDADGDVTAETIGSLFHLRYHIRAPRVFMEQWLVLSADGQTASNSAEVSVMGMPWMHLTETIKKQ